MAANDVYVSLESLGLNAADFVNPAIPKQRTFKLASAVVKAAIRAAGNTVEDEVFEELNVAVNAAERKLTITLDEEQAKRYIISEELVLDYSALDFSSLMVDVLGFARVYEEDRLDAVKAALPAGLQATYDEQSQKLTVTPVATASNFSFKAADNTLATCLFQGASFEIAFADVAIDVAKLITNRALTVAVQDLVEPVAAPAPAEGDQPAAPVAAEEHRAEEAHTESGSSEVVTSGEQQ